MGYMCIRMCTHAHVHSRQYLDYGIHMAGGGIEYVCVTQGLQHVVLYLSFVNSRRVGGLSWVCRVSLVLVGSQGCHIQICRLWDATESLL